MALLKTRDPDMRRPPNPSRRRPTAPTPVAALWIGGIAVALASGYAALLVDLRTTRAHFMLVAEAARHALTRRISESEAVLTSLAALHQASENLNGTELTSVTQKLLRSYPYVRTVAYLTSVDGEERAAFEKEMRVDGYRGYRIREFDAAGRSGRPAGRRAQYLPISFLEPGTGAIARHMGSDALAHPALADAARRAIRGGGLAVVDTNPLTPGGREFLIVKATYLGQPDSKALSQRDRGISGAFVMAIDMAAMLDDLRRAHPGLLLDIAAAGDDRDGRWPQTVIPPPVANFWSFLLPDRRAEWTHALGDRSFRLGVHAAPTGEQLHPWAAILTTMLALALTGVAGWLRHRRLTRLGDPGRRENEARLAQAWRMEAIGELTGAVAHEFNNMLSVIGGFARMVQRNPDDRERTADAIATIIDATEQGTRLTGQMLAFSRKQELTPRLVPIAGIVDGVKALLPPLMGGHIAVEYTGATAALVRVDPAQLSQALLNLAINARDAMSGRGTLTIAATVLGFDEVRHFGPRRAAPGRYVAIRVGDTGHGIPPDALHQVFEPFYTTKDVDKGAGLGLSMVYGLMAQSDGFIDVESEPGRGTAVTLYMPEADAPTHDAGAGADGKRLALVVEPHPGTRGVTATTLEEHGFAVIAVATANEARRIVRENRGIVRLLVCSATLAESSGAALFGELAADNADLRGIFLIRHGIDDNLREQANSGRTGSLNKPIDPDLLSDLVDEIF